MVSSAQFAVVNCYQCILATAKAGLSVGSFLELKTKADVSGWEGSPLFGMFPRLQPAFCLWFGDSCRTPLMWRRLLLLLNKLWDIEQNKEWCAITKHFLLPAHLALRILFPMFSWVRLEFRKRDDLDHGQRCWWHPLGSLQAEAFKKEMSFVIYPFLVLLLFLFFLCSLKVPISLIYL